MLLYLPRRRKWQRRTAELLDAPLRPDEIGELNAAARARFRQHLDGVELRRIFISCGETSSEGHARAFVAELRQHLPDVQLVGFGGRALEATGVRLLGNLVDVAVIGAWEVIVNLFFFVGVLSRYVEFLERERPDVVVLLDNPGLHMLFAEEAKKRGIPVLYYICPQYWAWAPWRMRRFRRAVHGAISILPFERPLFEAQGIPTAFAGSPLLPRVPDLAAEPRDPVLAILPGSRRAEIERHLPGMLGLWKSFKAQHPDARAVIPQQNTRQLELARRIASETRDLASLEIIESGAFAVLAGARAAIVKSGTSTLQTALCRTPQVIVYAMRGPVAAWLTRQLLTAPWFGAPNLVLGRAAFPEFAFHGEGPWSSILDQLLEVWDEGAPRTTQLAACEEICSRLDGPGATTEMVRWLLSASSPADDSSGPRAADP